MRITVKEVMVIVDTLQGSLKIKNEYDKTHFNFSEEDRKKLLMHMNSLADSTCITLEGNTGSKK